MLKLKNALATLLLSLFTLAAMAQKQTITGTIRDAKTGQALPGVSIRIKSTGTGTRTDANGMYTLSAAPTDQVEVTMTGYETRTIAAGSLSTLNVNLEPAVTSLSDVVVTGSRGGARAKTETAVPVDVIRLNQLGVSSAKMDLTSILNYAAPSFNYNKQTGADGADHIDLGTLRGLGPDQTLVLINGKRRHTTAFVGLFGTRGRGNSGADLNGFPQASVDHIEILRDGASAQYGSDAMAGVINIILKKDINHWNIQGGWAGFQDSKFNAYKTRGDNEYYYSKPIDGGTLSLSANNGFAIGKNGGFVNISLDVLKQNKTFRQVADTNVMTNPNAMILNTGRRAFGDGSVTTVGAMYNMEIPLSANSKTTFYSFGGYNHKSSDAFAYSRNLSGRPDRFPSKVDPDNPDLLIPILVPSIMHTSKSGETYYNPHIQTKIVDVSFAAGLKGGSDAGWHWDLSNTIGKNDFHYFGDKTFNASIIGNANQTHFDDGGFNFLQNTTNLDFSKSLKSVASGLNLGLGAEFRYEKYAIYKGEEASYKGYDPGNAVRDAQAPGAQGFPGFSPDDVIDANRTNLGAYADAELNVTKAWLVDGAVRFENYSDFGSVFTWKLATRLKLAPNFNIRGSVSTGFRAPSLAQINFSNTLTSFSGGQLVQSRIARNGDEVTKAAGIPNLKQETSFNASLGFSWKAAPGLTFTVDGYMVKVKNRIVLSGLFSADDPDLPAEFTSKLQALGVSTAQFFGNAVSTTNKGIDIVADYNKRWGKNGIHILLAGNIQHMKVDEVHYPDAFNTTYKQKKTFFSDREEAFLLASAPRSKFSLGIDYTAGKFGAGVHLTYYGKMLTKGFGWTGYEALRGTGGPGDPEISGSFTGIDPYVDDDRFLDLNTFTGDGVHIHPENFEYSPKVTTDLYFSYQIAKPATIYIGADNLFNVHPDFAAVPAGRYQGFDNETGGAWESVQMGFNGRRLFARFVLNF
jgi:iron complex outermembrane recepter protein